jgi:hypothetical protein
MKNHLTRMALVVLTAVLLFCTAACGKTAPRYFSYLDSPFCATLSGKLDGLAFAATLTSEGRASVGVLPASVLTFTSPPSLAGVKVQCDPEAGWKVTFGDLEGQTDGEGMGLIASLLLSERAVSTSRREAGCVILTLDGGVELWLDEKTGLPQRATFIGDGRSVEVAVMGWE